ncbi:MAG: hypothetical protein ACRD09_10785 [Vicinamibacterales bacterium]
MAIERVAKRQLVVLGVLLVTLAGVVVYNLNGSEPAEPAPPSSNPPRVATRGRQAPATPAEELDLRLETLSAGKPAPEESDRNPFRFRPAPAPPVPRPPVPTEITPPGPPPPPGPPSPPPIPLKFIGVIEASRVGKVSALKDERGVYHGREGEIVVGQYRIVRIGVESIIMEYADGRGRQTIRLSGQ